MVTVSDTQLSPHFTLAELTKQVHAETPAVPDATQLANLYRVAAALERVRVICGDRPIVIHSGLRTPEYNKKTGGAQKSAHLEGLAVDFHVVGMSCDDVRAELLAYLGMEGWRVEINPGANWVHLDLREPGFGGRRYFQR